MSLLEGKVRETSLRLLSLCALTSKSALQILQELQSKMRLCVAFFTDAFQSDKKVQMGGERKTG